MLEGREIQAIPQFDDLSEVRRLQRFSTGHRYARTPCYQTVKYFTPGFGFARRKDI